MPACLSCREESTTPLVDVNGWTYWDCGACGAAFLDQALLSAQDEVHRGRAYKLGRLLVEARNQHHNRWLVELVRKHGASSGGRVLEVGCGAGFFVQELQQAGFDARGVDLGTENAQFSSTYLGVEVLDCDFLTAPLDGGLDWVVMHQLIEHIPEPAAFIARAKELLRPGGSLLITTPNLRFARRMATIARLRGKKVGGDALGHPPSHCVLFEPRSLERLLSSHGMQTVEVGHNPTGFKDRSSRSPQRIVRRAADRLLLATQSDALGPIGPNFYSISSVLGP